MKMRILVAGLLLLVGIAAPKAQLSMTNVGGADLGVGVPQNGDILLIDNTSILLQVDNASFVCRAAGC